MGNSDSAKNALSVLWASQENLVPELDEDCTPNKVCKNMKDVSFEGFAENGGDIRSAWKETLRREGKLNESSSIGTLVNDVINKN